MASRLDQALLVYGVRSGCKGHRAVPSPAAAVVAVRGCVVWV